MEDIIQDTKELIPVGQVKLKSYQEEFPNYKAILLQDGKVALIMPGKGKHAMKAQRLLAEAKTGSDENTSDKYLSILMSMLVTIDKTAIIPEDLEEMPLSDYTRVQKEFSDINFTLVQAT